MMIDEPGLLCGDAFLPFDDLLTRSRQAATALRQLGIERGDTVALLLRNDIPLFEASFAAAQIGAATVPINWHGHRNEVEYILADCKAKLLVAHTDLMRDLGDVTIPLRVAPTPTVIRTMYDLTEASGHVLANEVVWSDWIEQFDPMVPDADLTGPGTIVYTSGTTGKPKGVRRLGEEQLPPGEHEVMLAAAAEAGGLAPGMRTVVTGPMYHSAPNAFGLVAAGLGGFVVVEPRFDAERLLGAIEEQQITHLSLVPTMFVRLLKLPQTVRRKYDMSSLQSVVHGAAPCPPAVKRQMIDWFGPVVREYYGATETGAVTACTSEEWLSRPGTVGRILPGATVRIYSDDGKPLGPGEAGEIYMWHRLVGDFTYEGNDGARAEIERDGLVSVGDVGYLDDDGFLYLCDRKRDMVISGGVNIYPVEIEACLLELAGVRDCAVFGIPDDEFGESLCAAIELEPGARLTVTEVQDHVAGRLARFKAPKVVMFEAELPREDSGKIFKGRLRAPYWEPTGRAI